MRTSSSKVYGVYSGFVQEYDGGTYKHPDQIVESYIHTVERSDVVHNPRNPGNGWRDPSGYHVLDVSYQYADSEQIYITQRLRDGATAYSTYSGPSAWIDAGKVNVPTFAITDEFNHLAAKALIKARDQKVNIALAVAEMGKTVDLIASRVLSLYNGYKYAKRGNFKRAAKELGVTFKRRGKPVAKNWLELQYGWLPLLSDIHGAYNELTRETRNRGLKFKVTARDKLTKTLEASASDSYWNYSGTRTYLFEQQIILWFEVQNQWLLEQSAVGLANPVEIAWELLPFSFVLDWALPVGEYLAAQTATQGLTFLGGTTTTRTTMTTERTAHPKPSYKDVIDGQAVQITTVGGGTYWYRSKQVERVPMRYAPWPDFPAFKNPISNGHALNALALLRSIF